MCSANQTVHLQVARMDVGMLFYFALASLAVYGTTLAGWASYNKWSLLGGMRASSQMMSYEVTMGLSVLGAFLVYGTLEPGAMVVAQGPLPWEWGIVKQPLGAILFFTAAVAETEAYAVRGEHARGGRVGSHRLLRRVLGHALRHVLPRRVHRGRRFPRRHRWRRCSSAAGRCRFLFTDGFHFDGHVLQLPHGLVVLAQTTAWGFKVIVFCWFQLLVRWTFPRFRPDQLMSLGWKTLLPVSLVNILVTAGVVLAFESRRGVVSGRRDQADVTRGRQGRAAAGDAGQGDVAAGVGRRVLGVTMRHFFTNIAKPSGIPTLQYPEETLKYPERFRGLHRLMLRDDGSVRCVACMCCPTICPAHCITIVAEETGNGNEKRPAIFEIDELRCVVCGLCVEAMPLRRHPHGHQHPRRPDGEALLRRCWARPTS